MSTVLSRLTTAVFGSPGVLASEGTGSAVLDGHGKTLGYSRSREN